MKLLTKSLRRHHYRRVIACFLAYLVFFNTSLRVAWAGPEGAQVVNGEVAIQQSAYNTTITASDKAIINYSRFDIAQPETVQFMQPGSSATVLNRILSANPTNINGTLLANGRVFFVNPAGVYIGNGARINVNQLVASGLNISNADFINGNYNFAGGNGAVINNGDISAQQVYLIGKQVTNSGNISCPDGYVVMAAGDRVFLGEPGSDIVLDVEGTPLSDSADAADSGVGVLNEGTVDAAGGIIALAAAGDIYSQAISNVGSLSTSVEAGEAGEISLAAAGGEVTNTGTIEASGSEGGQIAMEGARVGQFGTVHADGAVGNGGNVDLTASDVVALSSDSLTTANAGVNGNGGEVIAYSPDTALFWPDAKIEAKGGIESGDGGFVEVSGKEHVEVYGVVDTGAPSGQGGTFYLDPFSIAIDDAGNQDGSWVGLTWTPIADTSIVTPASILSTLNANTVIVDATAGVGGTGQITVNSSIDLSDETGTLRLLAETDIDQDAAITNIGNGMNLELLAKYGVDIGADITATGTGNVTINADNDSSGTGSITRTAGTITMAGGDLRLVAGSGIGTSSDSIETAGLTDVAAATTTGDIFINNSTSGIVNVTTIDTTVGLNAGAGDISLLNTGRDVTVSSTINTGGGDFTSSGIDFDNTGGAIATAGGNVGIQNTGDVTIGAAINAGAGDVDIDGGAGVATSIGGGGTITSSGTITFEASGSIGVIATAIDTAGTGAISASSTDSDIYIDNTGDVTDLRLIADSGTIAFTNIGSIDTGAAITANAISLTSSGTMTIDEAVTADSGAVTLSGALVDIDEDVDATGNVDIDATGNVDVDNGRIIAGGTGTALTIDGAGITLNAGGSGTETVTNTGEGTITITDSGNTTLDNHSISIGEGTLTINSANIYADSGNPQDEIDADGDISLTGANIGGADVIDIAGDAGDSTLTINSNGGGVGIRVNDDLFDAVDITIADVTDDTFDIIWGTGSDEIDMETDSVLTALTVTKVDTSNFDTDVDITQSAGNVLVESVDTDAGDFTLTSTTGAITDNTGPEAANITATNAFLTASTGIGGAGDADIDTDVDTLTAHVTGVGDIYIDESDGTELADVDTLSGSINIVSNTGDLTIGDIDATGTVTLEATFGSINDADADVATPVTDITAATVDLDATTGIGATEVLELDVANLIAETDTGGITLTEDSGLTSADVTTTGASSHIQITTGDGGTTWTDVDTSGAGSNIALTSGTGTTILTDVDTVDGTINVSAGGAVVATAVDTGNNNNIGISTSSGNITVGAIDAGTGTVTLDTDSGAIDDADADPTTDITAGTVDLDATTGIGATEALELDVANLIAETDTGGITLTEDSGLTSADVTTTGASSHIQITTGDGGTTWTDVDTSGAGSNIALTSGTGTTILTDVDTVDGTINVSAGGAVVATAVDTGTDNNIGISTSGDITVGAIDAGAGTVTLATTSGSINDADADVATPVTDITAATVDLDATTGIGATEILELDVANLEAHSTAAGDIVITESDGITLTDVDTFAGDIVITAGGLMNAVSVIATDGSVDLSAGGLLTATDVQANDSGATGDYDVILATSAGGMDLQSVSADNDIMATATADDIEVSSLTADNAISLNATNGAITQSGGIITANGGSLTMTSEATLSMINYNVANPGITNLTLDSTGGSAKVTNSAADDWNLITAAAQHNVVLSGDGDITTGNLESRDVSGLNGIQMFTDTGSGGSLDAQGTVASGGFVTVNVEGQAGFAQPVSAGGNIGLEAGGNITTNALTSTNGNIVANSTGGGVSIGGEVITENGGGVTVTAPGNIATQAITTEDVAVTTNSNIELESTGGNLEINGSLTANGGGVSLVSTAGKIYTGGADDTLNVPITGSSNQAGGIGVGLPLDNGQKAAIVISSKDSLTLGASATLSAGGTYDPANPGNDDRQSVGFATSGLDAGDAIDIAIYVGSIDAPIVDVRSSVTNIGQDGAMVIDAFDTVRFGDEFENSAFNVTHWLEVVSRDSDTLQEVVVGDRLPYAFNPEGIRTWFDGTYVLRGKKVFAEILALANPAPLAPPRPLELELGGEVERPDTEALAQLLSELGIGVQPFVTEAYATSLSTDLRLYKAAEKLQQLIPILEDADGTRIAGLREAVAQFFPTLDVLSDEQMDSFAQQLASHKGDGTDFDMAGQCIFALIDYVNILGTEIGWPVEKSVEFVMGRYVPRLTEGDEVRIAVVQMHLQKAQAEPGA